MKILLLAYACEPNRGSEPGVGWQWAINLARDRTKEVHVLTRSNNQDVINSYWKGTCPQNLIFHYYDLPKIIVWAKHHGMPVNIYYILWLFGSSRYAYKLQEGVKFDLAHHITFGVFRDASLLYKLKIPYIIGPVGGGEMTPEKLLCLFSKRQRIKEYIRYLANIISLRNPYLIKSFNNASLILAKTEDTKTFLCKWKDKVIVNLEIGINSVSDSIVDSAEDTFLFVGRFTYWKGVKLVLLAFSKYIIKHPKAKLIFIGKGEMEKDIKDFASSRNIESNIEIIQWVKQEKLKQYYTKSTAMLFPSLHDSSGNVVLESLSFGLPVICLNCGGPATILGNTLSELVVNSDNKHISNVVDDIIEKMELLSNDLERLNTIRFKCLNRAKELLWDKTVSNSYNLIEGIL